MKLNEWTTIDDIDKFLDAHSKYIERNKNNKTYHSYLERYEIVKKILNESSNRERFEKYLEEE